MRAGELESVILYAADLTAARRFYAGVLNLPIIFEDSIVPVLGTGSGRIVLHRNDRAHDERGIFPVGEGACGAAVRFSVEDPDAWEKEAANHNIPILWTTQDASWGRFVVVGDPDGRPVILVKMNRPT
jgi:catechol 2,3-dioxygenase-like lactoylglutathione lyase family enzyme